MAKDEASMAGCVCGSFLYYPVSQVWGL